MNKPKGRKPYSFSEKCVMMVKLPTFLKTRKRFQHAHACIVTDYPVRLKMCVSHRPFQSIYTPPRPIYGFMGQSESGWVT